MDKQKLVLIVEDEKNIVDILRFNLQREGYATCEAYDGADGLERLIFDSVMAFARTGNPGHAGLPAWPASTPEAEQTMIFDTNPVLRPNHDRELMPLFETYMTPIFEANREQITEKAQH